MGFGKQVLLFGGTFIGVIGGHMLVRRLLGGGSHSQNHYPEQQQQPQQRMEPPRPQGIDSLKSMNFAVGNQNPNPSPYSKFETPPGTFSERHDESSTFQK